VAAFKEIPQPQQKTAALSAESRHVRSQPEISQPQLETPKPKKPKGSRWKGFFSYGLIVVIIIAAGYLAYDTWQTNQQAKTAFIKHSGGGQASSDTDVDETPLKDTTIDDYKVAPDMPRVITIDSADVKARVFRMGVDDKNRIGVPRSIWDTGWYDGSAKPGEKGVALIDGHISGPTQPAIFEKLPKIDKGTKITIERGDGTKINYAVESIETKKLEDVDMNKVLTPTDNQNQTLALITCGGQFNAKAFTYDSRVIVMAKRVA